jgi:polyketide synthase-associated protein
MAAAPATAVASSGPAAPVVSGLRVGALVKIAGGPHAGKIGQLGPYSESSQAFTVHFLDATSAEVEAGSVKAVEGLAKPGEKKARADSFDLFVGPETTDQVLADETANCLLEKGFCVLRLVQNPASVEDSSKCILDQHEQKLFRLPEEVEEHYLGTRGKAMWLDADQSGVKDDLVRSADESISGLASLLQPYVEDNVGAVISERTPALLSMSFADQEEDEPAWVRPPADDKVLGTFLGTWRRQVLKVFRFLGPGETTVKLARKEGANVRLPLLGEDEEPEIIATPGTLLVYRTGCFAAECVAEEARAITITASFLKPAPSLLFESSSGDAESLLFENTGPPPPKIGLGDENVLGYANIMALGVRIAGNCNCPEDMFAFLMGCTDGCSRIPFLRFDIDIYLADDMNNLGPGQTYCQHTSIVEGAELFDNKEFEISNLEAAGMDVRQRHVMEVGGMALAGIGITKKSTNRQGSNGGIGVGTDGHEWPFIPKDDCGALGNSSNALGITANRFSYTFNMRGPNFLVDTACSASLYAAHYIRLSLLERRFDPLDFALAVGTQCFIDVGGFVGCGQAHMLSLTGRCFTFNASADGYLRGDGTNAFVSKYGGPEFREDRWGIFRSSNVNQDGRSASLTAPNGPAQEQCIWGAIREARISPAESTVWDCHGTGTSLGDPIEVGAVRKVQIKQPRTEPLLLGSIKSNIGHLEGGAAASAMMKCIMQVGSCKFCPIVHFNQLNPHLENTTFDALYQNEGAMFHYEQGHSQVSSYGFGGSNAHGIFWGERMAMAPDILESWQRRLKKSALPEVRPVGTNPDNWDSDYPSADAKPGDKYTVTVEKGDTRSTPIKWVKVSEANDDEDEDINYDIVGNFNNWEGDRMMSGSVRGMHVTTVEVPEDGKLEFRFTESGQEDKILAPSVADCRRRTVPVIGPAKDLTNKWVVIGEPAEELEIQLLVTKERKTVTWLKPPD